MCCVCVCLSPKTAFLKDLGWTPPPEHWFVLSVYRGSTLSREHRSTLLRNHRSVLSVYWGTLTCRRRAHNAPAMGIHIVRGHPTKKICIERELWLVQIKELAPSINTTHFCGTSRRNVLFPVLFQYLLQGLRGDSVYVLLPAAFWGEPVYVLLPREIQFMSYS